MRISIEELPQNIFDPEFAEFTNSIFSIAEIKFKEIGLEGGIAIGYIYPETGNKFIQTYTANKGGKHGWSSPERSAVESLISRLDRMNNHEYPNVRIFGTGEALLGVSISSEDGKGYEVEDIKRNGEILEQILEQILEEVIL